MSEEFKGKTGLVSGAGSGIGREAALLFAQQGAIMYAADLNDRGTVETRELARTPPSPPASSSRRAFVSWYYGLLYQDLAAAKFINCRIVTPATKGETMHLELARTIAQTPKHQGSHSHIFDNNDAFVWAEHGEEIEQFNALAGADAGFEDIEVIANDNDAEDTHSYRYKGKALTVPLVDDRDYNLGLEAKKSK